MAEKVGKFILKYKGVFLLAFAILFVVTIVGTVFLVTSDDKINSDMVSYLDDDSVTKRGLVFLQDQFDVRGNATLVVRVDENSPDDVNAFRTAVTNVTEMKSVSSVTWYGSVSSFEQIDDSLTNILSVLKENRTYLESVISNIKDQNLYDDADKLLTLLKLADYFNVDFVDTSAMQTYLRHSTDESGVYDYVLVILTDVDSGDAAYTLLDNIKAEFGYTEFGSTGTTETAQALLSDTMKDLPWFIVCGVLSVLIILIICSSSFVEPFILLTTLGVGIVISMGMNYLFPSISIISFAISAVLQLAITMDYAIFFTHVYRRNRVSLPASDAAVKAFPEVSESVLASGFTTVGGFAALYCMKFRIGTDIANVLIKGVIMSMVTVLILQPVLTVLCDKLIERTTHSYLSKITAKINSCREKKHKSPVQIEKGVIARPVARFAAWQRIVLIVIAVGLLVPSFIAQSKVKYSYLELYEKKTETREEQLASELGNQLILAVPLKPIGGLTQKAFIEEVKAVNPDRITGLMGAFTAVDISEDVLEALLTVANGNGTTKFKELAVYLEKYDQFSSFLRDYGIENAEQAAIVKGLFDEVTSLNDNVNLSALNSLFRKVDGKWYTLYTISFNGNTEDDEAQSAYNEVVSLCAEYFGKNNYYPVGIITSSNEMGSITPRDFMVVTLVSAAIIYVVVTLLLRNPLKSLIIIVIIELGIWINLAFNFLFGQSVNFIVYVIISSVELGCTVDYAILFANTFEKKRSSYESGKACAIDTATEVIPPILTSALMIGSVCMGMYLISNNLIIKQLTGMLARGALISFILVVFVQTAVWSLFPSRRRDRKYEEKLLALENETSGSSVSGSDSPAPAVSAGKAKKKKLTAAEKLALLEAEENADGGEKKK